MPAARAALVLCDALPTRWLGCYGGEFVETPGLDRFAHDAVAFDQFCADPSSFDPGGAALDVAAILGQLPGAMFLGDEPLAPAAVDGAVRAELAGRADFLVPADAAHEFWAQAAALLAAERDDEPAPLRLFAQALDAAAELRDRPGILVVEAAFLGPWAPPPEDRGRHQDEDAAGPPLLFAPPGAVGAAYTPADLDRARAGLADRLAYFDMALGTFLAGLDELALPNCAIAVVARRGLPTGEHGRWGLGWGDLLPEEHHAALVVRRPGCRAGARRPELFVPADLPELLFGPDAALGPPAAERAWIALRTERAAALRSPHWKCVRRGAAHELYDRTSDRWEVNDLARPEHDRCERWAAALAAAFAQRPARSSA